MKLFRFSLVLILISFIYTGCSRNDVIMDSSESTDLKEISASHLSNDINTRDKIHYALSVLLRIEQQLLLYPDKLDIDFSEFDFTIKMLEKSKKNEIVFSTQDILEVCNNSILF